MGEGVSVCESVFVFAFVRGQRFVVRVRGHAHRSRSRLPPSTPNTNPPTDTLTRPGDVTNR